MVTGMATLVGMTNDYTVSGQTLLLLHHQCAARLAHALRQEQRLEQLRAVEALGFRLAIGESIGELILLADVVEDADVGMFQVGDGFGFALEALAEFGLVRQMRGQDLDRHQTIQAGIAALIDFPHPPHAQQREDFMGSEMAPGF